MPDGAELLKNGNIVLSSNKRTYPYNANVNLTASLQDNGHVINVDSYSKVMFNLDKLYVYSGATNQANRYLIYDRNSTNRLLTDVSNVTSLIHFNPASVPASG